MELNTIYCEDCEYMLEVYPCTLNFDFISPFPHMVMMYLPPVLKVEHSNKSSYFTEGTLCKITEVK